MTTMSFRPGSSRQLVAGRGAGNRNDLRRLIGYYDNIPRQSASEITDQFLDWQVTSQSAPVLRVPELL